jgi:hypothetical protein
MDLYLGSPHRYIKRVGLGYALSHEMDNNTTIEIYKSLNKLILDNGADELGEGQGGLRLAYLAGRLNPNWIILPDVLHRDKKTRKRGVEFYNQMKDSGYHGKFMSVIQAKTLEKGLDSYAFWDDSGMVDRIGVTYDTMIETEVAKELPSYGKRLGFLEHLATSSTYVDGNGTGIHMLGTLDVEELYYLKRDPWFENANGIVESHDTTAPYACDTHFRVEEECISFGRDKDWPRLNFNATFSLEREEISHWNVACYLTACKVPYEKWSLYLTPANASYYYENKGLSVYY